MITGRRHAPSGIFWGSAFALGTRGSPDCSKGQITIDTTCIVAPQGLQL